MQSRRPPPFWTTLTDRYAGTKSPPSVSSSKFLTAAVGSVRVALERLERVERALRQEAPHRAPHHLFERRLEHLREAAVAVQDGPVLAERRRPLVHRLDHDAIGVIGPLEREDARPFRPFDDERLGLSGANRLDGLLGLVEPEAQLVVLGPQALVLGAQVLGCFSGHQLFSRRSSPKRVFSTFDRSPMKRRSGAGSTLIKVGVAIICSSLARAGFW